MTDDDSPKLAYSGEERVFSSPLNPSYRLFASGFVGNHAPAETVNLKAFGALSSDTKHLQRATIDPSSKNRIIVEKNRREN